MTKTEKAILVLSSLKTSESNLANAFAEAHASNKPITEQELLVKVWGDTTMLASELTYFVEQQGLSAKFEAWLENEESL